MKAMVLLVTGGIEEIGRAKPGPVRRKSVRDWGSATKLKGGRMGFTSCANYIVSEPCGTKWPVS